MRVLPVGGSALLVEVATTAQATALYDAFRTAAPTAVVDVVPAARTVLFDGVVDPAVLRRWLAAVDVRGQVRRGGRLVELPTTYDGPDLEDVARLWNMTTAEVVATHCGTELVVAFCGFAPGFAYCTGLGRSVPRLGSPRPRVTAGSVGLAGEFTGVYPTASPGGWRIVGRTAVRLWDPASPQPALLTPGTRVRFLEVAGEGG